MNCEACSVSYPSIPTRHCPACAGDYCPDCFDPEAARDLPAFCRACLDAEKDNLREASGKPWWDVSDSDAADSIRALLKTVDTDKGRA